MMLEKIYHAFLQCNGLIGTDTRTIAKGCMFFALKGANFNGNQFANQALGAGAKFVVIDEPVLMGDHVFLVDDVLTTLQQLARHHRRQLKTRIIAITGSNGKTTTKELLHNVLGSTYNTLATRGNLNNHIGVPLTLLQLTPVHDMAIVEMGANHQGEIASYCDIAEPDFGLINNVGKAHLEGFGGFEGVIKGKTELYRFLQLHNRVIFCNAANPHLAPILASYTNTVWYNSWQSISGQCRQPGLYLQVEWQAANTPGINYIDTRLTGAYNFENIMAAIAIGKYFSIPAEKINAAIASYVPDNARSQVIERGSNKIIMDAYNANPTSMRHAIENFNQKFDNNKIVALGDMYELGQDEDAEHLAIISLLGECNLEEVILVGSRFAKHRDKISAQFFDNSKQARDYLQQKKYSHSHFLIKGSRSSKMELVLEGIL
ncbi:MAG: UDP-N-acetylmuramoyl-tripeptide--D-alanyl-D-alanine ligase [Bacteroidetes bacterium]|nr:UDP-N-acetylmuramoyl-tripeptide--D-alanyl-D-alanine ligase [Bacteroidota bacterium]